jgi:hypothetical protein
VKRTLQVVATATVEGCRERVVNLCYREGSHWPGAAVAPAHGETAH